MKTPSGEQCPWCADENSEFDLFDFDDAEMTLCRSHLAEWAGTTVDGLDRMYAAERADMDALGYYDGLVTREPYYSEEW